jgi:hypothetical protein
MVINMYFHNGNFQSKETFSKNECLFEELYVSGLSEGHYLKSQIPYFYTSANGHLSISTQIRSFGYYDVNHDLIKTVELTFITECQEAAESIIVKEIEKQDLTTPISIFLMLLILLLVINHERARKNAKNRIYR